MYIIQKFKYQFSRIYWILRYIYKFLLEIFRVMRTHL